MTRRCFDSITAADIPAGSELVAGYIDGIFRWSDADWALFPDCIKVRIAVLPITNDGQVLDVEPGDATPTQAVDWVRMRRMAGADPTIYCGISDWQAVRDAFTSFGEPEPHYWIAHYDGLIVMLDGAVAKQWGNPTFTGGHYDESVVADYWPGVDKEVDVNGDDVKNLIREMLGAPEGAALVKAAITAPGGYGEALEKELNDRESRTVVETLLQVQESALKPRP